jgi:hypothetical protein
MIKLIDLLNEIKTPQYHIYCDMDGVLADFEKGFKNLSGEYPDEFKQKNSNNKFWNLIDDKGLEFWTSLEWMPGGKQLWNHIEKYNPDILSAPSYKQSSKEGKRKWIDNNISPSQTVIFKPAKEKHEYAGENKILIDDRKDTIDRWNNAGGIGILHTNTPDTLKQLKKLGL